MFYKEVRDKGRGPHILTGPVHIEGAEPGDVLEVRIQKIDLAVSFAYNAFRPGAGGSKRGFRTRHAPPRVGLELTTHNLTVGAADVVWWRG